MKKYVLCALIFLTNLIHASSIALFHTQDRAAELRREIVQSLENARESILILTFTLSDPEILSLLKHKAEEGVKVTVVIDKDHQLPLLAQNANSIEVVTRHNGEGRIHHKILVVDQEIVWIGSANFTASAYSSQENMMVRISSRQLAHQIDNEADVFRSQATREQTAPFSFFVEDQKICFALLPHDGFPQKKIEVQINKNSKQVLLEVINNARHTIKIAMMAWTDPDLAEAVIMAHKRGVAVDIVAQDFEGMIPKLMLAGISVHVHSASSLMHHKFMYVDGECLINGSANWSKSSFSRNDESFIVIDNLNDEQKIILDSYWEYLER